MNDLSTIQLLDDEKVYRHLPRGPGHYRIQSGRLCLSASAFSDPEMKPSVDIAKLCPKGQPQELLDLSTGVVFLYVNQVKEATVVACNKKGYEIFTYGFNVKHRPLSSNIPLCQYE